MDFNEKVFSDEVKTVQDLFERTLSREKSIKRAFELMFEIVEICACFVRAAHRVEKKAPQLNFELLI